MVTGGAQLFHFSAKLAGSSTLGSNFLGGATSRVPFDGQPVGVRVACVCVCVCFDEVNRGGNGMRPASFAHRTHLAIACRSSRLPTHCRLRACNMKGEVGLRVARILSGFVGSTQHASAVS